jgi:hypothetical protein
MVGSFEAWCDEKSIARVADKYIGEIRYDYWRQQTLVIRTTAQTMLVILGRSGIGILTFLTDVGDHKWSSVGDGAEGTSYA